MKIMVVVRYTRRTLKVNGDLCGVTVTFFAVVSPPFYHHRIPPSPSSLFPFLYLIRIIKTLKEWTGNTENLKAINKINRISLKFEDMVYKAATNRDDYLLQMRHKLKKSKNKIIDFITANTTGNQSVNAAIQKQVVLSCPTQQNPEIAPWPSLQQRTVTQPVLNKVGQDMEFDLQNAFSFERQQLQSPAYQQHVSVTEPIQMSNYMLNMERYQQSMDVVPPQISNLSVPDMARLASASLPLHPVLISQEQRNQFQESRMSGSQFHPHILSQEIKSTLQSPIPAAKAPTDSTALSASTDPGTTNDVDWQNIIERFQCLKTKLPVICNLLKLAEYKHARALNTEQFQKSKESASWLQKMIQFLHIPEQQLLLMSKDKCTSFMNAIMQTLRKAQKINMNNQVPLDSLSREQVRPPSTPVDSKFLISPQSSVEQAFPNLNSQSCGTSSSPNAHQNARQVTSLHPQCLDPTGIPYQINVGVRPNQNQQLIQQPSMNQSPLATRPSRMPQNLQTTDSQEIPAAHLPLTPVRSRSIPKEIPASRAAPPSHSPLTQVRSPSVAPLPLPVEPVSSHNKKGDAQASGDIKTQANTDVPAVSPHISKRPIERLMEMVQFMSRGALIESVNDIFSVHEFLSTSNRKFSHKRPKKAQFNCELMEEVSKVNQRLVETVIEVVSDSNEVAGIYGTVVKFTYRPVGSLTASFPALSAFSVTLHVPSDYPKVCPRVLDRLPEESSEPKDVLEKIQKIFQCDIRQLSMPIALGDLAQAWDTSARSVFIDFALSVGGKSLSSMCGTWECVPS